MESTIIGPNLPNIPWEDKPANFADEVWRFSKNPVLSGDLLPFAQGIYNSAVIPYEGAFAGVFRVEYKDSMPRLHFGRSIDGINWDLEEKKIEMICPDPELGKPYYTYDPRVCRIEDTYYVTWCNEYQGCPTIGMAKTRDFKTFEQLENAYLPFNRNGVLFPRKINGKYVMMNRPSDNGHTPFGDIYVSESPDMVHWGCHRFMMGSIKEQWWQMTKIGAGPIPIETTEGWLIFYHGVTTTCNGFVYSMGVALSDIDHPHRVKYRSNKYLLFPTEDYERIGFVPNVCFPCAALTDAATGRIAIYYGAADSVTALCFCQVDEIIGWLKNNSTV